MPSDLFRIKVSLIARVRRPYLAAGLHMFPQADESPHHFLFHPASIFLLDQKQVDSMSIRLESAGPKCCLDIYCAYP